MADQDKSLISRFAYWLRDRLNRELFDEIDTSGQAVLDVGGGSFYQRLAHRGETWDRYVVVEPSVDLLPTPDARIETVVASAELLPLEDNEFDLILAIQVLEHVFDPISATNEMYRCLRPGGRLVILVPQSGTLHLVPHHYQNVTRFWLFRQADSMGAEVVKWSPQGGAWRTIASRLFLMFWPVFDLHQTRDHGLGKRGAVFWVLLPFQVLLALILFPLTLILSLADIKEEANNHLFVLRKPLSTTEELLSLGELPDVKDD